MNDVEKNLFSIVQSNRTNLECLVEVYRLSKLNFNNPDFIEQYRNVIRKYSYQEDSSESLIIDIEMLVSRDKEAFNRLGNILYQEPMIKSLLTFYIPYLMWDIIGIEQSNLKLDKETRNQKVKSISR